MRKYTHDHSPSPFTTARTQQALDDARVWTERQQQDPVLQRAIVESKSYFEVKREVEKSLSRAHSELLNLSAAASVPIPEIGPVALHRRSGL